MLSRIWNRPRPSVTPRARLRLEQLEDRVVPSARGLDVTTVYVESNNPAAGQNAVLAFSRGAGGTLTQIGTFSTHGTGQRNLPKVVGPGSVLD